MDPAASAVLAALRARRLMVVASFVALFNVMLDPALFRVVMSRVGMVMLPAAVCVTVPAVSIVRVVDRAGEIAAVFQIFPLLLFPILRLAAVIPSSSASVKPS